MLFPKIIKLLIVVEIVFSLKLSECATWDETKAEHEKLANAYAVSALDYFTDTIPTSDYTQPLEVSLGLELYALGGYDAVSGTLDIMGSLVMSWTDEIKALKLVKFDGDTVPYIVVDYQKIWTPVIVLMNSADSIERVGAGDYKVRINLNTGQATWKPRMIVTASCSPDVRYFPFDQQTCTFTFVPWFQDSSKIKLSVSSQTWNLDQYDVNGVWSVSSTEATAYQSGNYYIAQFTISIKRAPKYFVFNLVLPILLLSLLSGLLFLLPAASGERCGFGITCFLSFVVLLQTTMNYLPQISSPMSLLCYYLIVMILFTAFLSIVNILLLMVYHKPKNSEVPKWLVHVIEFITFVKCKRKCCKRKSNAVEDGSISSSPSVKEDIENGPLIKPGNDIPSRNSFAAKKLVKHNENFTEKPAGKKPGIELISVLSVDSETNAVPEEVGTSSASTDCGTSVNTNEENATEVDYETVGRLLDLFFLVIFLGVEGVFSFFFLVPLGTRY